MEAQSASGRYVVWRAAAIPQAVGDLRVAVADYSARLGFDGRVADIALAVSEALSNAVLHGYADGRAGELTVTAEASPARLRVTVVDDGDGFTPRPGSQGAGLGLPIIAELADRFTIKPGPGDQGVAVVMSFDRPR